MALKTKRLRRGLVAVMAALALLMAAMVYAFHQKQEALKSAEKAQLAEQDAINKTQLAEQNAEAARSLEAWV